MAQRESIDKTQKAPFRRVNPSLAEVGHIVAVASGKGGVGKSTVASNLAVALRASGVSVGLMDADIYGPSQPGMFGALGQRPDIMGQQLLPVEKHGVKFISMGLLLDENSPVIWRAPIAMKMIHQFLGAVVWGELDYLLIDLPPGTGDVQLTLAQQAPLTGAIIVTTPQQVALGVARKGLRMFQQVNVPILGVIENMAGFTCAHCGNVTHIFREGGGAKMAEEFGVPLLGSIPLDPAIMDASEEGLPVAGKSPESSAAKSYTDIAASLRSQIEENKGGTIPLEPVDVDVDSEGKLHIEWPDGHQSIYSPYNLRLACQCAQCIDEDTGRKILDDRRIPLDISIESFAPVGRYALAFNFSDRHNTGIYSYERLRELCECAECAKKAGRETDSFSV